MQVGVTYVEPNQQMWLNIEIPESSTVKEAIEQSGILKQFPHVNLEIQRVGIFGKLAKLDAPLKPGDRVEIYRPIIADPSMVSRVDSD
jgi:putative ubiquitin-RnfH superfamily antitoxin RatB of RatAB toxin-antitoxin module